MEEGEIYPPVYFFFFFLLRGLHTSFSGKKGESIERNGEHSIACRSPTLMLVKYQEQEKSSWMPSAVVFTQLSLRWWTRIELASTSQLLNVHHLRCVRPQKKIGTVASKDEGCQRGWNEEERAFSIFFSLPRGWRDECTQSTDADPRQLQLPRLNNKASYVQ